MNEIIAYFEYRAQRLEAQAVRSEKRGNAVDAFHKRNTASRFRRFAQILKGSEVKS